MKLPLKAAGCCVYDADGVAVARTDLADVVTLAGTDSPLTPEESEKNAIHIVAAVNLDAVSEAQVRG
jgi:hypothetical protein